MMLINIGGSRGGHFRHANVEMMCICLGVHLPRIWTGNALKMGKMT